MNWKEFLKPDLRKVAIFLIIFFLLPVPLYVGCTPCHAFCIFCFPHWEFISLFSFLTNIIENEYYHYYLQVFAIFIYILELITFYSISCLIVWIYEKVKKK
jgi:hypothetical protein